MLKRPLLSLCVLAILAACQPQNQASTPSIASCEHPAIQQNISKSVQQFIQEQAPRFVAEDPQQLLSSDKIFAALNEVSITLNHPSSDTADGKNICRAELNITLPESLLNTIQANSSLVYPNQTLEQVLQQRNIGSDLRYNNNGIFTQSLQFIPQENADGSVSIQYLNSNLSAAYNALLTALLPYGVKDEIVLNGQKISREQALEKQQNQAIEVIEENASDNEIAASDASNIETETLTPQSNEQQQSQLAPSLNELNHARQANQQAQAQLQNDWQKLDSVVQTQLQSDQQNWQRQQKTQCQQVAQDNNDAVQAEYQQLQCETRLARERSRYLSDYSIQ
ncbi:MAG: hypothetical protein Q4E16_06375 [Neisseria sp.]|nr:hypothetical protein [Neisseria sp.]